MKWQQLYNINNFFLDSGKIYIDIDILILLKGTNIKSISAYQYIVVIA